MKIIDIRGKERKAISIKKIIHKVPAIGPNAEEKMIEKEYVEVEIKGEYRKKTWKQWYPFDKFKKMNPKVKL